jgi:hypothetical protein
MQVRKKYITFQCFNLFCSVLHEVKSIENRRQSESGKKKLFQVLKKKILFNTDK